MEEDEKEDLYSVEEDLSQRGTGLPASWRHFIVSSTPPKTSRRAKQVKPDPKISQNRVGKVKKKINYSTLPQNQDSSQANQVKNFGLWNNAQ